MVMQHAAPEHVTSLDTKAGPCPRCQIEAMSEGKQENCSFSSAEHGIRCSGEGQDIVIKANHEFPFFDLWATLMNWINRFAAMLHLLANEGSANPESL
jgi:hypothetical protein